MSWRMENFWHAISIHFPYWGGFWGWGRGAKPGTINLRGLCHFCPKKCSNFPSTKKISFVLLNITIVQLIITHINLGGAPWNGTFGFFEQCVKCCDSVKAYRLSYKSFGKSDKHQNETWDPKEDKHTCQAKEEEENLPRFTTPR